MTYKHKEKDSIKAIAQLIIAEHKGFPPKVPRDKAYFEKATCNQHYLDQTMCLERNPYEISESASSQHPPIPEELLYYGVSREHQGRYAYLKTRAQKSVHERYGFPATSNMEVGWRATLDNQDQSELKKTYMSPYARKPLIQETFYRRNGVFYK